MRYFSIFALLAASVSLASANTISIACIPGDNPAIVSSIIQGAGGNTSANCGGFAPAGFVITNLSLSFIGAFSDSSFDGLTKGVTYQIISSPLGASAPMTTSTGQYIGSVTALNVLSAAQANLASIANFNVGVNTTITAGLATPASGLYTVNANYTYEVQGGVPEPSTLALVGGVLVLAGIRKFRS